MNIVAPKMQLVFRIRDCMRCLILMTAVLSGGKARATGNEAGTNVSVSFASLNSLGDFNADGKTDVLWRNATSGEIGVWLMNGVTAVSYAPIGNLGPDYSVVGLADIDADNKTDILWRNTSTGVVGVWFLSGTTVRSSAAIGNLSQDYSVAGSGDFNGDGRTDLILRNGATGEVGVWLMNGLSVSSYAKISTVGLDYVIAATGDFSGDGKPDILWRNTVTGEVMIWVMSGLSPVSNLVISTVGLDYAITGVGDYNSDGKLDILWRNLPSGEMGVWMMNGITPTAYVPIASVGMDWISSGYGEPRATKRKIIDMIETGDGRLDILWRNTGTGEVGTWLMQGTTPTTYVKIGNAGLEFLAAGVGDFNGDKKSDVLWRKTTNGEVGIWLMNGTTPSSYIAVGTVGLDYLIAGTGDFNGDGKTDILWRNATTGEIGVWLMNGTTILSYAIVGAAGLDYAIAGTGDFNGDGKVDIIWRNTGTGEVGVWIMNGIIPNAYVFVGGVGLEYSIGGTGDFNGDGKTDILWRRNDGEVGVWIMDGTKPTTYVSVGYVGAEYAIGGTGDFNGLPVFSGSDSDAARFLIQATFGPSAGSIATLRSSVGYGAWIDEQMTMPVTYHMPYFKARVAEFKARDPDDDGYFTPRQEAWWQNSVTAPDQLRQRMAFALSEIFVISQDSSLDNEHEGTTAYYDMLVRNAFGNYRQLLEEVTLSPMMGSYLSMIRNQKPNLKTGRQPDENYAREIMQLFSIGLSELNADGTLRMGPDGLPIPTYSQADIVGLAHVFTGWGPNYDPANPPKWSNGSVAKASDWFLYGWNSLLPMTFNVTYGDLQSRQIVGGVTVPATLTGPQRLKLALDTLYNHPNVGPFLARQLIQRFVTSNPSPAYVKRVAAAFNDNGGGVRGDLGATLRAVLLDPEARRADSLDDLKFGKLTEPLLRMTRLFRAFPPTPPPYLASGDRRLFLNFIYSMDEQAPLFSPTVFNFFKPGFAQPGQITRAGLVSPEFQIYDDVTAMLEANRNYSFINNGLYVSEPSTGTTMKLDLAEALSILTAPGRTHADAQAVLVDYFNLRLLGGHMSSFLKQKIMDTLASLPSTYTYTPANEQRRVQLVLYLVMFSPDFNIQR